jgi:hypothetical protein
MDTKSVDTSPVMLPVLEHPFSAIVTAPSSSGKSTLVFNIIKNSSQLVANTYGRGFDSLWVIYRSMQPLYERIKAELGIPVYLFEKTIPDFEILLNQSGSKLPVVVIDDGICIENEVLVSDLFCRVGHHLGVSVFLINQSLFDSKNSTLRLCHKNTKVLILFGCARDQTSLRILIHQMISDRKRALLTLETLQKELEKPYAYVMIDYQITCPRDLRFKTNLLCEAGPYPIALVYKDHAVKSSSVIHMKP